MKNYMWKLSFFNIKQLNFGKSKQKSSQIQKIMRGIVKKLINYLPETIANFQAPVHVGNAPSWYHSDINSFCIRRRWFRQTQTETSGQWLVKRDLDCFHLGLNKNFHQTF